MECRRCPSYFVRMFSNKEKFAGDLGRYLGRTILPVQVESIVSILEEIEREEITDPYQIAYILATAWHESRLKPIKEIRAKPGSAVWNMQTRYWGSGFYGRGFVQLTWRKNYAKFSKILGVDLVSNPDLVLDVKIGAKVLVVGMAQGLFTGKSLNDYFKPGGSPEWFGARKIVNGTFQADKVANAAVRILPVVIVNQDKEV